MKLTLGMELDRVMLLVSETGAKESDVCALAHKPNLHAGHNSQSARDDTSVIATCCARIAARYARTVVFGIGSSSMHNQHA